MDGEKCMCPTCGDKASLICSGCRSVRYCSKEHQKAHWKEHQQTCKAYKEEWDIQIGKHLVATRNLKPGDVILQEDPLIISPEGSPRYSRSVCVGCSSSLGRKKCPECIWPMCGKKLCWAEGSAHSQGECALLKAAGSRVTIRDAQSASNEVYYSIMVLRCLSLRDRDPKKWKKLVELKDCKSAIEKEGIFVVETEDVVKIIKRWLPSSTVSRETIRKLCRIFFVNSLALQPIPNHRSQGLRAVYQLGCSIDHNCVANSTSTFTKDGQLVVRAAILIPKGAKISLNKSSEPLWCTLKRRHFMLSERLFLDCHCERCKDPTELGTFVGGIFCPKCPNQKGILLPEKPLEDKLSDWVCNKCSHRSIKGFIAAETLSKVGTAFGVLNRQSIPDCEAFIRKFSRIVHPNHSYLTEVKMVLCDLYGQSEKDELLDKKESLAREMLEYADILSPGLSRVRATLLHHIYSVLMTKIDNARINDADISASELMHLVTTMREVLMELLTILSFEPEESDEGEIYQDLSIRKIQTDMSLAILKS